MNAITFGRYNFFTVAHLSTVKEILKKWEKLYILIVDDSLGKTNNCINGCEEFYNLCDKNHKEKKIYFSIEERMEMINLALLEAGIKNRVIVLHYCRPECNIKKFNDDFEKNSYDLVFPCSVDEPNYFDKIRNDSFEKILGRRVFCVFPKITIHVSQILFESPCAEKIKDTLPDGTKNYFEKIGGYKRVLS
ncbi:adenylyltransferase/cytidyltransferase family protein [bacterium]|nr:adenylyltransferase/cytidyltransferase family protein [bacterium]